MQLKRIEELDALRGIAALMVLLFHFTMGRPEANWGFKLGTTGVDLFFIISGFVIFMSLEKVSSSWQFIINRTSRLYPTYWACVSFSFLLLALLSLINFGNISQLNWKNYVGNLTMFQFYLFIPDLEQPYWTMIVEMLFYISILLLFHFKLLRFINIAGFVFSVLAVLLARFFFNFLLVQQLFYWVPLLAFIPLFFAGILFNKIYRKTGKEYVHYFLLLLCLYCQIYLFHFSGRSKDYIAQTQYAAMLLSFFALFIFFVKGKLRFIISKPLLYLGKISFPLYLLHQFVSIKVLIPFLTNKWHLNFWVASLLITLPIVIIIAGLITKYVEIPATIRMKNLLRKI